MEPTELICQNPKCGKPFVVTRRYAKPKRYCTTECGSRHRASLRHAADKETANAQSRAWHKKNREIANARRRKRRLDHLDEERENVRRWNAAHKEKVSEMNKRWYAEHQLDQKAKMRARYRALVEADPDKMSKENRKRHQLARRNAPWIRMLRSARMRAKKRSFAYDLSIEWVLSRWTGACELSGLPFRADPPGTPGQRMMSPSIARIDPTRGYVKDNCRIILWALNSMKSDGTDEMLLMIAKSLS